MYQMTRVTAERGALSNDDRLDALAMAVAYWVEQMAQDADKRIASRREETLMAEVNAVRQSLAMGLAVVTGHLGGEKESYRW